jgi:hypothetical protein
VEDKKSISDLEMLWNTMQLFEFHIKDSSRCLQNQGNRSENDIFYAFPLKILFFFLILYIDNYSTYLELPILYVADGGDVGSFRGHPPKAGEPTAAAGKIVNSKNMLSNYIKSL